MMSLTRRMGSLTPDDRIAERVAHRDSGRGWEHRGWVQ